MLPCPACGAHTRASTPCPLCGTTAVAKTTAVALLLGLAACVGETTDKTAHSGTTTPIIHTGSVQVDYGVSTTYTDTDTYDHTGGSGSTSSN